jgi:hypothetical protein
MPTIRFSEARAILSTHTHLGGVGQAYPTARDGLEVLGVGLIDPTASPTAYQATVRWLAPDQRTVRTVDSVASRYPGPEGALYLMPGLGEKGDALAPLMVWWALLYALSHLARYQPAAWTEALDPVRSTLAVPIESALAFAREVMPHVILHELVR